LTEIRTSADAGTAAVVNVKRKSVQIIHAEDSNDRGIKIAPDFSAD
jgi:hypothetical protein